MDPPSTPPRKRLTRDQRRDILCLRRHAEWTYEKIACKLKISQRAVQYTCQKAEATPQHCKAGRAPKLNQEEGNNVIEFVISCKRTRRLTYNQVAEELWPEGEISGESVKYLLHLRGYRRRIALRKPPISEDNRLARLAFAHEHLYWSEEQWNSVLWSDETWVKPGFHRRILVTRKVGEQLDTDCIIEKERASTGWMFWACFSGNGIKGPHLFWEKDWGSINSESYIAHTIPIIQGWIRMNPDLIFMQDNAPGHASKATRAEILAREIPIIFWPAYSPDLNPIENLWNEMKDWLQLHYPARKASYDQLRAQVYEAWLAIPPERLQELVQMMKQRCQDVIDANGMHTKW